ncbi:hypothetical protein Tco_1085802 [Tanacetum coccineum]
MQEVILFYKGLDVPTRQILDSKGAIPSLKAAYAKKSIQDMDDHSQKWHNGTSTRCRSTETYDGLASIQAQLNYLGREIKKLNEKVYAAQVGCELCKGSHYTKDYPLKEEGKTLEEAYYTKFGVPFQQRGQYRAAVLGFYQRNYGNPLNQGASIKALEIQIEQMSKVLQEGGSRNLPSLIETSLRYHVKSISKTVNADTTLIRCIRPSRCVVSGPQNRLGELATTKLIVNLVDRTMKHPKEIAENVLVGIDKFVFLVDFIVLDMTEDMKIPFDPRKTILRVYALSLRERMELNLEARLMGEALVLDRSLDLLYGDYIELNDLNEPLELRRNRVDDLEPTIEE